MLVAAQVRVPLAKPDAPVEFVQLTWVTPTLSVAVPRKLMAVALVAMTLAAGYVITIDGGVLSVEPGWDGFGGGGFGEGEGAGGGAVCWRTTDTCCVAV